jgi:thioredoxin-like negative regulator of GroEL
MISEVDETTFRELVLERSHQVPVVVLFTAAWCQPCRTLKPRLEEAASARKGGVELVAVDADRNTRLVRRFRVWGLPSVKAFRRGNVVKRFTGARSQERVERFFHAVAGPLS